MPTSENPPPAAAPDPRDSARSRVALSSVGLGTVLLIAVVVWQALTRELPGTAVPPAQVPLHTSATGADPAPDAPTRRVQWRTPESSSMPPDASVLPDETVPLLQALPRLEAAATRGDTQAAWQLQQRLWRCTTWRVAEHYAPQMWAQIQATADPARRAEQQADFRRAQSDLCYDRHHCAGSTVDLESRQLHWLVQAARMGHPDARTEFAIGGWMRMRGAEAYPEFYTLYQAHALAWMESSAQRGDLRALEFLAGAYLKIDGHEGEWIFDQQVAQDVARGLMLVQARLLLAPGEANDLDATLRFIEHQTGTRPSVEQWDAAAARAVQWIRQHRPDPWRRKVSTDVPEALARRVNPSCVQQVEAP